MSKEPFTDYDGNVHEELAEGMVKITYKNGNIYEGGYYRSAKSGKGKLIYPNGKMKDGYWYRDKFVGEGENGKIVYEKKWAEWCEAYSFQQQHCP